MKVRNLAGGVEISSKLLFLGIVGALMVAAVTVFIVTPRTTLADANLSCTVLDDIPFENEKQIASMPTWQGNSSIKTFGAAKKDTTNILYSFADEYSFYKAGDGILIKNVGTDVDGDDYDLKITMTKAHGQSLKSMGVSSYDDSLARFDVFCSSGKKHVVGERLCMYTSVRGNGDLDFRYEWLKHGTSEAANVLAFMQIGDLDNYIGNDRAWWADDNFNGGEGVQLNDGKAYLSSNTKLSKDVSNGKFWISKAKAGNTDGKDWSTCVAYASSKSYADITLGAATVPDIYFDPHEAPAVPVKDFAIKG